MRSPVEDHDLVPSLPGNIKSQTHSRVSECDGRPSVQVEQSPVNRIYTLLHLSPSVTGKLTPFFITLHLHKPQAIDNNSIGLFILHTPSCKTSGKRFYFKLMEKALSVFRL